MEKRDEEIIARALPVDEELRKYVEEHRKYEQILDDMNKKPYLTTQETLERKRIQKLKLAGKDKIEAILAKYREKGF